MASPRGLVSSWHSPFLWEAYDRTTSRLMADRRQFFSSCLWNLSDERLNVFMIYPSLFSTLFYFLFFISYLVVDRTRKPWSDECQKQRLCLCPTFLLVPFSSVVTCAPTEPNRRVVSTSMMTPDRLENGMGSSTLQVQDRRQAGLDSRFFPFENTTYSNWYVNKPRANTFGRHKWQRPIFPNGWLLHPIEIGEKESRILSDGIGSDFPRLV